MAKILAIDYEKCTGCRSCELACSIKHEGVSNPSRSRIKIIKWEEEGRYVPMTCQQCKTAPCLEICPVRAISRDEDLNRLSLDYDTCIGCRMCVAVCPFGAMAFDTQTNRVRKCDFCDGDPQCVRFCDVDAVTYVEESDQNAIIQMEAADKFSKLLQKASEAIPSI